MTFFEVRVRVVDTSGRKGLESGAFPLSICTGEGGRFRVSSQKTRQAMMAVQARLSDLVKRERESERTRNGTDREKRAVCAAADRKKGKKQRERDLHARTYSPHAAVSFFSCSLQASTLQKSPTGLPLLSAAEETFVCLVEWRGSSKMEVERKKGERNAGRR